MKIFDGILGTLLGFYYLFSLSVAVVQGGIAWILFNIAIPIAPLTILAKKYIEYFS